MRAGPLAHTSLMGPDKKKVLQSLPVEELFAGTRDALLSAQWQKEMRVRARMTCVNVQCAQEFAELHDRISAWDMTPEQITAAERDMVAWVRQFKQIHAAAAVTPYLHAVLYHLAALSRKWGGIGKFNNQGVEGKNGQQTKECRRNVAYGQACKQIIEREHRMLLARMEGLRLRTRKYARRRRAAQLLQEAHQRCAPGRVQ